MAQHNSMCGAQISQGTLIPSILFHALLYHFRKYVFQPKVPWYRQASLPASWHPGAIQIELTSKKFAPIFFLFSQKNEETIGGGCVWITQITYFHPSRFFVLTKRQKVNYTSYHHYYSPAPSGGPQATKEGTNGASKSEAVHTQVQRASSSSSVMSVLHPDPSSSNSDFI
jgi:hypothetical protein